MDWVKQLGEVTNADLDAVEVRLTELNNEAIALRALKAVFRAKLGIKPEPAPAPAKPAVVKPNLVANTVTGLPKGSLLQQQRTAAAKFLMANGPTKPVTLCNECDIPQGSSGHVFAHPWFRRTDRGVELTQEGKQAATAAA